MQEIPSSIDCCRVDYYVMYLLIFIVVLIIRTFSGELIILVNGFPSVIQFWCRYSVFTHGEGMIIHMSKWNESCVRPWSCTVRLYWAGDNQGLWDSIGYTTYILLIPFSITTYAAYIHHWILCSPAIYTTCLCKRILRGFFYRWYVLCLNIPSLCNILMGSTFSISTCITHIQIR